MDFSYLNEACIHDTFATPFSDEYFDKDVGKDTYLFSNGFSRYHQVQTTKEEKRKTTFAKWVSYAYNIMPPSLKNTQVVLSQIITNIRECIFFLELYLYYWIVYNLFKDHFAMLCLMFERCGWFSISFNLKRCIFYTLFGMLLGHFIYKNEVLTNQTKVAVIVNLEALIDIHTFESTFKHTRYCHQFIKGYATITTPMESFLERIKDYVMTTKCQASLDILN